MRTKARSRCTTAHVAIGSALRKPMRSLEVLQSQTDEYVLLIGGSTAKFLGLCTVERDCCISIR